MSIENRDVVPEDLDPAVLESPVGRQYDQGAEPGGLSADDIVKPIGAVRRSDETMVTSRAPTTKRPRTAWIRPRKRSAGRPRISNPSGIWKASPSSTAAIRCRASDRHLFAASCIRRALWISVDAMAAWPKPTAIWFNALATSPMA